MTINFDIDIIEKNKDIYCVTKQDKIIKNIKNNIKKCVNIQCITDVDIKSNEDKKSKKSKNRRSKNLKRENNSLHKSLHKLRKAKDTEINSLKQQINQLQQQLDITCTSTKYIDKWDGFYIDNNKWKLMNDRQKLKGIWRSDSKNKYFCIFLNFDSSKTNGGIYSCSIKWEHPNDSDGLIRGDMSAPCCIGISTQRDIKTIKNGIKCSERWPDWSGDFSSHFDSTCDEPGWYINEIITIKLDLDNSMVYYFKDNKLCKKENIHHKLPCYVMLCACPNIAGECCYFIVNPIH